MPLLICLTILPAGLAARTLHRFTWLGVGAVLAVTATGFFQGWVLGGGLPGLGGTPYGRVALVKAALLLATVVLAATNGLVLTRRLAGPDAANAQCRLLISIRAEVVLGLMIILAAGWLASLAPGSDIQPAATSWGLLLAGLALPTLVTGAVAAWLMRPVPITPTAYGVARDRHP